MKNTKNKILSERESECLCLAAEGHSLCEIANKLNISEHTVKFHNNRAIKKMKAINKINATAKAIIYKYINPKI